MTGRGLASDARSVDRDRGERPSIDASLHRVHEPSEDGSRDVRPFDGRCIGCKARAGRQSAGLGRPAGGRPHRVPAGAARYHGSRTTQGDRRPMPHVATSPADLIETITGAAHLAGDRLVIDDEKAFRDTAIRDLAWTAAFSDDEATTAAAQWLVWEASQELGALSASIHELYHGPRSRGGRRASRSPPSTSARRRSTWRGRCSMRLRAPMSARSSSRSRAASRPTPTSARSISRHPCSPAPSPQTGELPCSSRATTTSSTRRSTRPTPRR